MAAHPSYRDDRQLRASDQSSRANHQCREAASETPDSKLALFLFRLADEVEAEAREADLM